MRVVIPEKKSTCMDSSARAECDGDANSMLMLIGIEVSIGCLIPLPHDLA